MYVFMIYYSFIHNLLKVSSISSLFGLLERGDTELSFDIQFDSIRYCTLATKITQYCRSFFCTGGHNFCALTQSFGYIAQRL